MPQWEERLVFCKLWSTTIQLTLFNSPTLSRTVENISCGAFDRLFYSGGGRVVYSVSFLRSEEFSVDGKPLNRRVKLLFFSLLQSRPLETEMKISLSTSGKSRNFQGYFYSNSKLNSKKKTRYAYLHYLNVAKIYYSGQKKCPKFACADTGAYTLGWNIKWDTLCPSSKSIY